MKIALSFRGKIGHSKGRDGHGDELDLNINFNHLKKYILDEYENVDIFIHSISADIENSKEKLEIFKPIYLEVEKQKKFGMEKDISLLEMGDEGINGNTSGQKLRVISEKYSMYKCLDQVEKYEEENKFKYDVVMITRLDVGFFKDIDFSKYDMNYFYASNRNDPPLKENNYKANYLNHYAGYAFQDLWFFSNSENLDKFSKLYDEIENYEINPHRSSMQHVKKFIGKNKIKYTLYRWFDYELLRRKFFKSKK